MFTTKTRLMPARRAVLLLSLLLAVLSACGGQPATTTDPAATAVPAADVAPAEPAADAAPAEPAADAAPAEPAADAAATQSGVAVQNEAVRRWVEAVNAGDVDAFAASLSPTAVVLDSGRTFEGVEAIQRWSERELIGAGGSIEVESEEPTADGTILNVRYSSRVYNGRARYIFVVQDGLVARVDMVPPTT